MVYKRKRSYSRPGYAKRRKSATKGRRYGYVRRRRTRSGGRKLLVRNYHNVTNNRKSCVNLRTIGLPLSMIVKFPYREYFTYTTPVGGIGQSYAFLLNSLYDPNNSGAGDQPRYFDQLVSSNLYRRYIVYRADVQVKARNRSSDDCMVTVAVRNNTSALPSNQDTLFQLSELPYTGNRILHGVTDGGPGSAATFNFSVQPHRFYGMTKAMYYADERFSAYYNASPVLPVGLIISLSDDPHDTSSGITCEFEVQITFYAKIYELGNTIGQS